MPHMASMLLSEPQRDQVCDRSRILIERTLLQCEEIHQMFVGHFKVSAFTDTWSKPRLWFTRDKARSNMAWNQRLLWLLGLFFWLFNPWFFPLKFLNLSSFWIASHLLIRSKFSSPVVFLTHSSSPALCLSFCAETLTERTQVRRRFRKLGRFYLQVGWVLGGI